MIFSITLRCNRRCSFCFEGEYTSRNMRDMTIDDVHRLMRWAGPRHGSRNTVLGGEPTLHPQFIPILEAIASYTPAPTLVLTNGLSNEAFMDNLSRRKLSFLVNINDVDGYSAPEHQRLMKNLDTLCAHSDCVCLATTITSPDNTFPVLEEVLARHARKIASVRLGISTPGVGFLNTFPREFSLAYGEKFRDLVLQIHRINPRIAISNECAINHCLMTRQIYDELAPRVANIRTSCERGNPDILPDFSTHWCFAARSVPELVVDNVFAFPSMDVMMEELHQRMDKLQRELGMQCDHGHCETLACPGPCIIHNAYRVRHHAKWMEMQAQGGVPQPVSVTVRGRRPEPAGASAN
jgi:sulfatase maturation enzyme AslB (radical SAM superfamily)